MPKKSSICQDFKMKKENITEYSGVEPLLYIVTEDIVAPGEESRPAIRNSYILECNEEGCGSVKIGGKEFAVKPRTAYFILPGQTVAYTADKTNPRRGISCFFSGIKVGKILAEVGVTPDNPYIKDDLYPQVSGIAHRLLEMKGEDDLGADLRRTACIYELLGALARSRSGANEDSLIEKALGVFEAKYEYSISVSDVAAEVGFDRSYFSTLFKAKTGVSPHDHLTSLRVSKACVLLRENKYTVSEIAESVGLDPCNFARIFKRKTGKTPLEFKKSIDKS